MFPVKEIFEPKKSEKDAAWGDKIIRFIRMNWNPLIGYDEAEKGMEYLLSMQSMDYVKQLFQDTARINLTNENDRHKIYDRLGAPIQSRDRSDDLLKREMRAIGFTPLPIWEKRRNVLVAEMKKMGIVADVRSSDPVSTSKRLHDAALIENGPEIEANISKAYQLIGQPAYSIKDHKNRFGEKPDHGNTALFEALGLNAKDPADRDFFMKNFHKLDMESSMQSVIDFVSEYNQWTLEIEKWVNDLIAKKAVAATAYVSDVTGAIMTKYLAPETVFVYGGGNRQDFNDATAKGYERKVTIKELLDILGDKFDMDREMDNLLMAITFTSRVEFNGVKPSYRGFVGGTEKLLGRDGVTSYSYNDFIAFRVTLGRIEFTTQNEEISGHVTETNEGFYENNQSTQGKYPENGKWDTPTYKAHYLAVSSVDQVLFDFGELEYKDLMGSCDFNMNFTIITYKATGQSLTLQSMQIIDMVNEAWYKFRYELRRAKPRGRSWNYDSVITSMMDLIPDTNSSPFNKLQKVIELLDSSSNEFYTFPVVDGKTLPLPGNQLNSDIPNGMSKESMLWWQIMMDGIQLIDDMIGFAPLRQGDPGNPRDSMNNQFKALEYSQESTYYIPDMLTYLYQQMAVKANFFAQDIVNYKKYNTLSYRFLESGVGEDALSSLEGLGDIAPHRFGIFVESLNQAPLRQKLDLLIDKAVQNGTITLAQVLLISEIKSVKKAFITLAYFEQRNVKIAQQQKQQEQQAAMQMQQQMQQMQMAIEQKKIDAMILGKQIEANVGQQEHLINQQGGITKTKMKIEGDFQAIYHQAFADFAMQQQKLNQAPSSVIPAPLPTIMPPQQGQDAGAPGLGVPPQSPIDAAKASVVPAPTSAGAM